MISSFPSVPARQISNRSGLARLVGRRTVFAISIMLFALLPLFANPYQVYVGNLMLIYVILTVGLNMLLGLAGQLAFANGALFGVGAYTAGLLRLDAGLPFWLALPAGAVVTTVLGLAVALPALRLRGLYLALATIAFAQFAQWTFVHWDSLTYGNAGFVMSPVDFGAIGFGTATGMYYTSLAVTVGFVTAAYRIVQSRIGRALIAIRESEVAAMSIAVDVTRTKIIAYSISALYAGTAGGLFAGLLGVVVPESFNLFQVVLQFCMVVVGGLGSVAGAVIGAVLLIFMQEALRGLQELQEIGLGLLLLVTLLLFPGGMAQALQRWVPGWSEPHSHGGDGP